MKLTIGAAVFSFLAATSGIAGDWPQFRGAGTTGVSADVGLPAEWNDTTNLLWKAKLPGHGSSSPIVVGERVYITCYSGYGTSEDQPGRPDALVRHVMCLNRADGNVVWKKELATKSPETGYRGFMTQHGYASHTPACDGERLYVFLGTPGVYAFDLKGEQLWHADVGTGTDDWGTGSSPILEGDLLIVNGAIETGAIVAFKRSSGAEAWRFNISRKTWSTPAVVESADGQRELVVSADRRVHGVDPNTGKELWSCEGIQDYVCPTVVPGNGVAYVSGGRQNSLLAIQAGGHGDVSRSHVLWRAKVGANVPTPVLTNGHIFGVNDRGVAYCVNAESGNVVYQQRLTPGEANARPAALNAQPGRKGRPGGKGGPGGRGGGGLQFYGSCVAADGKVYVSSRTSGVFVIAADPVFKFLANNQFDEDSSISDGTPAIADRKIYIRSNEWLYCIGTK